MAASRPVVLVTGSGGLIGRAVCSDLKRDFAVVGFDQELDGPTPGMKTIRCDLTRDADVRAGLAKVRASHGERLASVVHLAAYYDFTGKPSPLYEKLTVQGTRRLLGALQRFEVGQFCFSSTILVMKAARPGRVLSETSPLQADWDYPESKLLAEAAIRGERGAIPALILRIAGVYDEDCRCWPIAQQIRRIHRKELESYFFPGDATRGQSVVHLDDVVAAIRAGIERRTRLAASAEEEILLIGEPEAMSYAELQDEIGQALHGRDWPTVRIPKPIAKVGAWARSKRPGAADRKGTIQPWMIDLADRHYPVSVERARRVLGWRPRHRVRDVLPEMLRRLLADPAAWYAKNGMPELAPAKPRRATRAAAKSAGR